MPLLLLQKEVYVQVIRSQQVDDIFEGRNTIANENVCIRKINLQKRLKSRKFNVENFWTTRKSYKFQEKIAMPFVL